jgi:hypothetical protein
MLEKRAEILLPYLRQNGDRYSLDALRRQMATDGHGEEAIEEAIRAWQAETAGRQPIWKLALGVGLVNVLLTGGVALAAVNAFGHALQDEIGTTLLVVLMVALAVEAVGGLILLFMPRHARLGRALLAGFGLYAGLGILSVGGFCLFWAVQ